MSSRRRISNFLPDSLHLRKGSQLFIEHLKCTSSSQHKTNIHHNEKFAFLVSVLALFIISNQ